jgi:hypothetical protein
MRVRHLNDIEIQALLDRRTITGPDSVSGERYRKDLDSQEHLDNCSHCRTELELYRELYGELGRSNRVILPRNFARKVTFSLPPFRARRTRMRIQLAAIWAVSMLVSLFWLFGRGTVVVPLARLAVAITDVVHNAGLIINLAVAMIPSPEVAVTWFLSHATILTTAVERAFSSDFGTVSLVMFAGLVLLMTVWLDSYFFATVREKR